VDGQEWRTIFIRRMSKRIAVVNNYSDNDLFWVEVPMVVYDKKELNVGYNIYDYLSYIVDNYNDLPDVVLFMKGNMLKRHISQGEWDKIKDNTTFTPILTQNHEVDNVGNKYIDGLYYEKNDSWYLYSYPRRYYTNYNDFARDFDLPTPEYLGFAPGGCYIVPKKNILKHGILFYEKLRSLVSWHQTPAEAHMIERALHTIWS